MCLTYLCTRFLRKKVFHNSMDTGQIRAKVVLTNAWLT